MNVKKHFLIRSVLVFHIGNSVFISFTGNIMLCGFKIKQLYIYLFIFSPYLNLFLKFILFFLKLSCSVFSISTSVLLLWHTNFECSFSLRGRRGARGEQAMWRRELARSRKFVPSSLKGKQRPLRRLYVFPLTQVSINFLLSLRSENLKTTAV